jgi:hypothetical protein
MAYGWHLIIQRPWAYGWIISSGCCIFKAVSIWTDGWIDFFNLTIWRSQFNHKLYTKNEMWVPRGESKRSFRAIVGKDLFNFGKEAVVWRVNRHCWQTSHCSSTSCQ